MSTTNINDKNIALRGVQLLQNIVNSTSSEPLSFQTLSEQSELNYFSLKELLHQLEQQGYIEKLPHSKHYIAGRKLFDFSLNTFSQTYKTERTRALTQLSNTVKETCNCSLLGNAHIIYLDRVEANWSININLKVGSKLPLNCTASGKLLLAYMPAIKRNKLLEHLYLVNHTENSIIMPEDLEKEFKIIRQNGYAIDNEELFIDTVAISVPVFLKKNTTLMAVAIHAPKFRKSVQDLKSFLPELKNTAETIQKLYRCD